ncbi:MAG: BREX-1 system adenine-specific DNA-methyltransferase PglX, partial [Nitrospira sp.]|nr:BREX-1 system adenine-specific DNA-methyltransferase PglX [Nitrospira sp.]
MKSAKLSKHAEWLSLIEISGPFLTVSMLEKAFPQGLEAVATPRRQKLRAAYEEWREAVDQEDRLLPELHGEWVRLVLTEMLEYDQESLVHAGDWPNELPSVSSQEHTGSFKPDWIVRSPTDGKPRLFLAVLPPDTDLESVQRGDGWPVSLQERMTLLCRTHGVRVGLLTDGERWMLVNAPVGSTSSQASWYARLWYQEPITLKAFQSLLGVHRCFGPAEDTLESLLDESLKHHEEVTDTLGEQVRRAVEVLVQCLDKADEDRNRKLLHDVKPAELYEAGLTVMMRLVFVLCAEERGLLLLGDLVYDRCYAVSTLRGQLAEEADRHGPEVLDRRHDAWARLLAVFRAIYGGIEHESLRMPALGGSLFDPDRFPFLEGRTKGTRWRETSAAPLPIDNRTVLLLLNSLQVLEQSGGALLLSYRALDVEQIGHVYEGLLEHTVARVPQVTLGLKGSQKAKNPNVALAELESARLDGEAATVKLVVDITGRSESAIRNGLSTSADNTVFERVLGVCGGDTELAERIRPFTNLLRTDAWDDPIVYHDNSFMVTLGADRRETGTHYTPKSLTESIVTTTLEPVVYVGPAEGIPREEWKLKSSREILDLKVCDPAMGSGAFLVQTCRYLGEKLVEAWFHEE